MEPSPIGGARFRAAFVLLLVAAISALFTAVAWPFLKSLLFGAIIAGLCRPTYHWLTRLFRGRTSLASAVTIALLILVIVGPISAFLSVVVRQAVHVSTQAIPYLRQHFGAESGFNIHDSLVVHFPSLSDLIPEQDDILDDIGVAAKSLAGFLVAAGSRMTAGTAAFLLHVFVMLYATFYFLRDGGAILEKIFYYMPLSDEDEERMLHRFVSVTRATVKGTLIIGLIQGTLSGLAFWMTGIEGAAFWGTIMVILAIVPGIGAALIWVPGAIFLFATGHHVASFCLVAWCGAVVGTFDHLLRPKLIGADAKMPDLLILVGTLGGLFLFGPIGFIVGPIVCGLFLTVWDIYGAAFKDVLPPVKTLRAGQAGSL